MSDSTEFVPTMLRERILETPYGIEVHMNGEVHCVGEFECEDHGEHIACKCGDVYTPSEENTEPDGETWARKHMAAVADKLERYMVQAEEHRKEPSLEEKLHKAAQIVAEKVKDEYPEHAKLMGISDLSQAIGDFLEWASAEKHLVLCEYSEEEKHFFPEGGPVQNLLAAFFDIDQDKLEAEKRQMLDNIRKANNV